MKNIITNILGVIFWGFSVYEMTHDASLTHIFAYVVIGGALFVFENATLKTILKTIIDKIK